MDESIMDHTRAINAGIALLDEKGPKNWREKIDLNSLDLCSLGDCVLGQVFGDYGRGMNLLFGEGRYLWNDTNVVYGFEAPDEDDEGHYIKRDYDGLTDAWIEALSA